MARRGLRLFAGAVAGAMVAVLVPALTGEAHALVRNALVCGSRPWVHARAGRTVEVQWGAATDYDLAGYEVWLDGARQPKADPMVRHQDVRLERGAAGRVKVVAYDFAGHRIGCGTVVTGDRTAPSAVAGVDCARLDEQRVRVSWQRAEDDSSGIRTYEISESPDPSRTVRKSGTSIELIRLRPSTDYTFTVVAIDWAANRSAPRRVRCAMPADPRPLGEIPVTYATTGDTWASLQLFPPEGSLDSSSRVKHAIDHYDVTYRPKSGGRTVRVQTVPDGRPYLDVDGLTPETDYVFTARAVDLGGTVSPTATFEGTTKSLDVTAPTAPPEEFGATDAYVRGFRLSWKQPYQSDDVTPDDDLVDTVTVTDSDGRVRRYEEQDSPHELAVEVPARPRSRTVTVTATATDRAGHVSVASAPYKVLVPGYDEADTLPPEPVVSLSRKLIDLHEIKVTWAQPTDPGGSGVAGYIATATADGVETKTIETTSTAADFTGLTAGKEYTFTVRAKDNAGNVSEPRQTTCLTDRTGPGNPQTVTVSNVTDTTVDLSWTPGTDDSGIDHYIVYANTLDSLTEGVSTTKDLKVTITGLEPGTRYGFAVRSVDLVGKYGPDPEFVHATTGTP